MNSSHHGAEELSRAVVDVDGALRNVVAHGSVRSQIDVAGAGRDVDGGGSRRHVAEILAPSMGGVSRVAAGVPNGIGGVGFGILVVGIVHHIVHYVEAVAMGCSHRAFAVFSRTVGCIDAPDSARNAAVVAVAHDEDVAVGVLREFAGVHPHLDILLGIGEGAQVDFGHAEAIDIVLAPVVAIAHSDIEEIAAGFEVYGVRTDFDFAHHFEGGGVDFCHVAIVVAHVDVATGSGDAFGVGGGDLCQDFAGVGIDGPNEVTAIDGDVELRAIDDTILRRVAETLAVGTLKDAVEGLVVLKVEVGKDALDFALIALIEHVDTIDAGAGLERFDVVFLVVTSRESQAHKGEGEKVFEEFHKKVELK